MAKSIKSISNHFKTNFMEGVRMKKIISLLMVTILLIACISGCASENNNSQVPGESNETRYATGTKEWK